VQCASCLLFNLNVLQIIAQSKGNKLSPRRLTIWRGAEDSAQLVLESQRKKQLEVRAEHCHHI
jgi:hypothetical protein